MKITKNLTKTNLLEKFRLLFYPLKIQDDGSYLIAYKEMDGKIYILDEWFCED